MTSMPLASAAEWFQDTALSGPLLLAFGVCMLVGLISFASPCVVPLVPGYLSYLAGLVGAEAPAVRPGEPARNGRLRVFGASLLFVLGFTVVYTLMTVAFFGLTGALYDEDRMLLIQRIGGVVVILMGLIFLGTIRTGELRIPMPLKLSNWLGAPVLGAVFAVGWIPCTSATLSVVLITASGTEGSDAFRGTLMVIAYCLGLGLPFVILAVGSAWAVNGLAFLRRNARAIQMVGGVFMLAVGMLLLFGWWNDIVDWIRIQFVFDMELPI